MADDFGIGVGEALLQLWKEHQAAPATVAREEQNSFLWCDVENHWSQADNATLTYPYPNTLSSWPAAVSVCQPFIEGHHSRYAGWFGSGLSMSSSDAHSFSSHLMQLGFRRLAELKQVSDVRGACISIAADLEEHLNRSSMPVKAIAPLVHLRAVESLSIAFGKKLTLRAITDDEASGMWGSFPGRGPVDSGGRHALVIEYDEPKHFTAPEDGLLPPSTLRSEILPLMDRAIEALRCTLAGPCSFPEVYYNVLDPILNPGYWKRWVLTRHDGASSELTWQLAGGLPATFDCLGLPRHRTMDIAIDRLALAETRRRSGDKLVDSVIGLEALLLSAGGQDKYKGELRYRFAVHYALLGPRPERQARFRFAKLIYDGRSGIVHGSTKMSSDVVDALARSAATALRETVRTFLDGNPSQTYLSAAWWDDRLFEAQ